MLDAREVELPIITYDKRCGLYDDATLRPGMLCAGYAAGNHDTCQVPRTIRHHRHHRSSSSAPIPNSKGNPFSGGAKYTGMEKIWDFRRKSPFISEKVRDSPMVTMER